MFRFAALLPILVFLACSQPGREQAKTESPKSLVWQAPDTTGSTYTPEVRYGYKLITNTSYYLGPAGILNQTTNGMNCRNCHLEGGKKPHGLNYGKVSTTFPIFRPRSGKVESISYRINDCLQRSLDGAALDTTLQEMKAMVAYIKWVGSGVSKTSQLEGLGMPKLTLLDRMADTLKGRTVYMKYCRHCHGTTGNGLTMNGRKSFVYPPLWGDGSYNEGAGMSRLSHLAGFVYYNMPLGVKSDAPVLTIEEAWDVAAFINAQTRPAFDVTKDWPELKTKPFDYPKGPYADTFSTVQHKYGPYKPIIDSNK